MTPVQRHAELVYAECLAQKAILGIVYSGDWLQFIKEAINMRACISLFKAMYTYLEAIDADAESPSTPTEATLSPTSPTSPSPKSPSSSRSQSQSNLYSNKGENSNDDNKVDDDFRSGVLLGMGVTHLVLSLLPGRIVPILELFGYKGERKTALELLERAGGWKKGVKEPEISREAEGLRRSLCMSLLHSSPRWTADVSLMNRRHGPPPLPPRLLWIHV
jgi:hypothetical protein